MTSATFAHLYREAMQQSARLLGGSTDSVRAVEQSNRWFVAGGLFVALAVSALWSRRNTTRFGTDVGLETVARADQEPIPSVAGTLARAGSVLLTMVSFGSLGREAPILEAGGSLGAAAGRRLAVRPVALAAAGIAAAFASAYHAPIAAIFYVREHAVRDTDRVVTAYAAIGAVGGFVFSAVVFHAVAPFPAARHPLTVRSLVMTAACVLPVHLAARIFFAARRRAVAVRRRAPGSFTHVLPWAALAALTVAVFPLTAGNGMDAIRRMAATSTFSIGVALLVSKLVATVATLATGVPGGVFSPSLAISGGAALAALAGLSRLGFGSGDVRWDAIASTMAMAVLVGTRAPLTAVFVIAEMCGDWRLVPVSCAVVGFGLLLEHYADRLMPGPIRKARDRVDDLLDL